MFAKWYIGAGFSKLMTLREVSEERGSKYSHMTSEEAASRDNTYAQVTVFETREAEVTNRQLCPDRIYQVCM